jgi:hypothetical protein
VARPNRQGGPDPLARSSLRAALAATGLVLVAGLVGAAVRLLPWVLDPQISWGTLSPFAKSLFSVVVEAALLTGWPVGWALAAARSVDRGEARVFAMLGASPGRTLVRLAPQGVVLAVLLAVTSIALGRDAAAPGRVVDALIAQGRASCLAARRPGTRGVPFVSATWICRGGAARLVGRSPVGEGIVFAASRARVTDDLRRIDLEDAQLTRLPQEPGRAALRVQVKRLTIRGLAPWARASAVPPSLRALAVTASAVLAACAAVLALLRSGGRRPARTSAVLAAALGASGPLSALAALRALEVRMPEVAGAGWLASLVLVPLAAVAAVVATAALSVLLPASARAGTK